MNLTLLVAGSAYAGGPNAIQQIVLITCQTSGTTKSLSVKCISSLLPGATPSCWSFTEMSNHRQPVKCTYTHVFMHTCAWTIAQMHTLPDMCLLRCSHHSTHIHICTHTHACTCERICTQNDTHPIIYHICSHAATWSMNKHVVIFTKYICFSFLHNVCLTVTNIHIYAEVNSDSEDPSFMTDIVIRCCVASHEIH